MPFYESVYIARPDISATQVETLNESLAAIITEHGGKVTKTEYWGLKNLAYKIKKNRKGHYSLLNIEAPHSALSELERQMRINEDVLRYISIKMDELEEGPSIMMQNKYRRDDRGPRGGRDDRGPRGGRDDRPPRGDRPERTDRPARTESAETGDKT